MSYWFLSFRDNVENHNLGVCVVEANSMENALGESWLNKCNPGGEVLFTEMTGDQFKAEGLELNRLYSRQEMTELGYDFS